MIGAGLKALGFKPGVDFHCQDDGEGPYIKDWYSEEPQPNEEDIIASAQSAEIVAVKAMAIAVVTAEAEAARNRAAPYSNYMDTEYQVLAAQADAYVLAGSPENPVGLDMLVQSATDSGRTIAEEADLVRTKRDQYIALLNATRSLRRQAALAIEAASDVQSINTARDQYVEQLAGI